MFAIQPGSDFVSHTTPASESKKELSHAPEGKIHIAGVDIDFGCDEYMASHIHSEYGQTAIDTIHTRGDLICFYGLRHPVFEYGYSSFLDPYNDNDYVFPKLEYLLAQECCQEDCSSQTRKAVLQMALDKQKHKYDDHKSAYTARQTGIFLIAVILVMENDGGFISAVRKNRDLQKALLLKQDIPADKAFGDTLIRYAESFLYNN
jgi:hypothetical protein